MVEYFMFFLFGGAFLVAIVGILTGVLSENRKRTLIHLERMKALELGRDFPEDSAKAAVKVAADAAAQSVASEKSPAMTCFSTALWVTIVGSIAAGGSTATSNAHGSTVAIAIAAAVGAVGVTALICGTVLAARTPAVAGGKPGVESDAFDVVSRRG